MKQEFIIMDASVKYMGARNILEEGLMYTGTSWIRGVNKAFRYDSATSAIDQAKELQKEAAVRVFMIQVNGNLVGFAEVNF